MFEPSLEVPTKRNKPFDSTLCLVCQDKVEKPKRGKQPVRESASFDVFVDVCKKFAENGDVSYYNLQDAIRRKTADQLYNEHYCYHTKCRSDFQKIYANQQRSIAEKNRSTQNTQSCQAQDPKVKRCDTVSFNKLLCLFCQEDLPNEQLFSVCQTSRDETLKEAFLECPVSLALYKIRSSHAYDAMAGDIKYHNSCWRTYIDKRIPEVQIEQTLSSKSSLRAANENEEVVVNEDEATSTSELTSLDQSPMPEVRTIDLRNGRTLTMNEAKEDSPESSLKKVIFSEIIEGLKIELIQGKAITLNNLVEVYKSRMVESGTKDPRTDKAIRIEVQRCISKDVCEKMEGVILEKAYERNTCQRVMTNDAKAFALRCAEESFRTDDEEIAMLKEAAMILRRKTLKFIRNNPSKSHNLKISSKENEQFPPELISFVDGLIFGQRKLTSEESSERKVLTGTIASSIMHNIKTDRQVKYAAKRKSQARHRYLPKQCITLALSIRHCERNNAILRLLSAPNFGMIVPPRIALLYETMIANAVAKLAEKDGVYIPSNMEQRIHVPSHLDNFDEQVQTFDSKNTFHYLLIVCFQRREREFKPIELTLEKTASLTLKDNSFGELLPCEEPSNRQFKRSDGCLNVTCAAGYVACRSATIPVWKSLRSFEHLLLKDETATYVSNHLNDTLAAPHPENESEEQVPSWNLDSLILPSLSATNSLVVTVDQTLTNIFPLPFVAGPASSTSAVFTALDIAHRTSAATNSNNEHDRKYRC